jgi:hypothetical protein
MKLQRITGDKWEPSRVQWRGFDVTDRLDEFF